MCTFYLSRIFRCRVLCTHSIIWWKHLILVLLRHQTWQPLVCVCFNVVYFSDTSNVLSSVVFYKYFQVFTILSQASWWTLILLRQDIRLNAVECIPAQATTAQWWPQSERWTCLSQYTTQSWIDSFKQVVESCLRVSDILALYQPALLLEFAPVCLHVCVCLFFLWWSVRPGATKWWMVEEDDRSLRWPAFAGNGGEMRYRGKAGNGGISRLQP